MSNMVTGFLLALDGNFDLGSCLNHVGTEGDERDSSVPLGILEPALRLSQQSSGFLAREKSFHVVTSTKWSPVLAQCAEPEQVATVVGRLGVL
jgi:hypothetical protein